MSMLLSRPSDPAKTQRGAATLLVSMVLLFATTLLVLYVARTAVFEQRISANEVRDRQARSAAQAGVDFAIANMVGDGELDDALAINGLGPNANASFRAAYCRKTVTLSALPQCATTPTVPACTAPAPAPPDNEKEAWVVSCGWSDDNAARQRIVTYLGQTEAFPNRPSNPLVARGGVNFGGNATVTNYHNNLTIWTGAGLNLTTNPGNTYIRSPDVPVPDASIAPPPPPQAGCGSNESYVCTTSGSLVGPDIIQNDTSLSNLNDTQFFANFFGRDEDTYRSTVDRQLTTEEFTNANLNNVGEMSIWVDGDASFPANTTIGSRDSPVVLIIDGDIDGGQSSTVVYGVVFVTGDWDARNVTVYGSVIVQGSVAPGGSLDVIYDPVAIGNTSKLDAYASRAGTWQDW